MKNLFKQNPALLPWLNGTAKFYNDMGNDVAEHKGPEYHVELFTYLDAVQMVSVPEFTMKLGNLNIDEYRKKSIVTNDKRGIWYELGMLTCALDTVFRFVEVVADQPEVLINKGCNITNQDKQLANKLYDFYVKHFNKLKNNCYNNLTKQEAAKYIRFID